jgi:hypothetical protein
LLFQAIFENVTLDFAAGRTRKIIERNEPDFSWPFVSGETLVAEPQQLIGAEACLITSDERYWSFCRFGSLAFTTAASRTAG